MSNKRQSQTIIQVAKTIFSGPPATECKFRIINESMTTAERCDLELIFEMLLTLYLEGLTYQIDLGNIDINHLGACANANAGASLGSNANANVNVTAEQIKELLISPEPWLRSVSVSVKIETIAGGVVRGIDLDANLLHQLFPDRYCRVLTRSLSPEYFETHPELESDYTFLLNPNKVVTRPTLDDYYCIFSICKGGGDDSDSSSTAPSHLTNHIFKISFGLI